LDYIAKSEAARPAVAKVTLCNGAFSPWHLVARPGGRKHTSLVRSGGNDRNLEKSRLWAKC